ncbi:MAG: hypothetical protein CL445_02435 [Acidimicrobiaceae bacterium]|nr:hypothetical protein [Acidimicrobiaceae bacterium]
MTASAQLRRRYTQQAAVAVAVSFTLAIILAIVGARTLASSTIGSEAGGDQGETVIALPETTTAFIGVVDDDEILQSAALIVLDPSGVGGAVVPFEAAADISAGRADSVMPLREALDADDARFFALDAESLTGLTFDVVEIVTASELADLLGGAGAVSLKLPPSVVSGSVGQWLQGRSSVSIEEATELLAVGGDAPIEFGARLHAAVWNGIVNELSGSADTQLADGGVSPRSAEEVIAALFAGDVETRSLHLYEVEGSDGALVFYDWAETLLVASHLAPNRVTAPHASAVVRLLVPFTDDDLEGTERTVSDVAVVAVRRLSDVGLNVVSVSTGVNGDVAQAEDVTEVWTGDESSVTEAAASFSELLGEVVARKGDYVVDGVDVVIILGTSFLSDLDRQLVADLQAWSSK